MVSYVMRRRGGPRWPSLRVFWQISINAPIIQINPGFERRILHLHALTRETTQRTVFLPGRKSLGKNRLILRTRGARGLAVLTFEGDKIIALDTPP